MNRFSQLDLLFEEVMFIQERIDSLNYYIHSNHEQMVKGLLMIYLQYKTKEQL